MEASRPRVRLAMVRTMAVLGLLLAGVFLPVAKSNAQQLEPRRLGGPTALAGATPDNFVASHKPAGDVGVASLIGAAVIIFMVATGGGFILVYAVHMRESRNALAAALAEKTALEKELQVREQSLQDILDHLPDAILVLDDEKVVRSANRAAIAFLGRSRESLVGFPFALTAAADGTVRINSPGYEVRLAELTAVAFEWNGRPAHLTTLHDITRTRRSENNIQRLRTQLAQASRLAMIGNMTGGVAHEINQPLAATGNYIQASLRQLHSANIPFEAVVDNLEKAARQVMRAGQVMAWLQGLVRTGETEKSPLDVNATIIGMVALLAAEIRAENAELVLDLAEFLPLITADEVEIQQVIAHLVQNSLEEARRNAAEGWVIRVVTSVSAEGKVILAVSDNGPGIPEACRKDLFSAFYTTKTDALGLGLAICQSIIERHGGEIWLNTGQEQRTEFVFCLPAAETAGATMPTLSASTG